MAIAFDVATTGAAYTSTGTQTTSHAAAAGARAAVVLIATQANADEVSGVTYGGVAMHRAKFFAISAEGSSATAYWLDGITGGTQNVAMTTTAASNKQLVVATMTVAAGHVVTLLADGRDPAGAAYLQSASVANPSWTYSELTSGSVIEAFELLVSGHDTMTNTPATNWTLISSADVGTMGRGFARQHVASSGTTLTCGWTVGAASALGIALAFMEADIGFDFVTLPAAYASTGTQTTSHQGGPSTRAVAVLIDQNASTADQVSGVTYAGAAMTRLRYDTEATEAGATYVYWLDNVTAGTQNVAMTTTGTANKQLAVYTIATAGDPVEVAATATGTSAGAVDHYYTMTGLTAGLTLFAAQVVHSGQTTMYWREAAGWQYNAYTDLGAQGRGFGYIEVPSSGTTLACGWQSNGVSEDYVGSAVAFSKAAAANAGTLSAEAPTATATIAGTQSDPGTLSAEIPLTTATLAGAQTDPGTLTSETPVVTAAFSGTSTNPATMAVSTILAATTLTGASTNPGILVAAAPTVTGSASGTQADPGALAAATPLVSATVTGTQVDPGTLAGTLPASTATLAGVSANPGTLAASTPTVTAAIAGTATNAATLAAATPPATAALTGTQTNAGTLSASAPVVTASLTGEATNLGALTAAAPLVTATLADTSTVAGTLTASTPNLSAAVTGTQTNTGTLAANAPATTSTIAGTMTNTGTLTAAAPLVTASLPGGNDVLAELAATTPLPVAQISGTSLNPGTLTASPRAPTAAITGTSTNPATLAASTPVLTSATTGTVETQLDITVTGTLDPRRWAATLPDRAKTGALTARAKTGALAGRAWAADLDHRRWKGTL